MSATNATNLLWLPSPSPAASPGAAALVYATNGWRIFPCRGKVPLVEHGVNDATTDEGQILEWWHRWPEANIGWAVPAGLFVLDVDVHKGGIESLRALEQQHAPLPLTTRAVTGTNGQHWAFALPDAVRVPNRAGLAGAGLDTRSAGGYIVVAPSIHPDTGRPYRWDSQMAPVAAPSWLLELVAEKPQPERKPYVPQPKCHPRILDRRRGYALAALRGEARAVADAPEGQRNNRLNQAWWRLAHFKDVLRREDVECELLAAALSAGLSEREARGVLR